MDLEEAAGEGEAKVRAWVRVGVRLHAVHLVRFGHRGPLPDPSFRARLSDMLRARVGCG